MELAAGVQHRATRLGREGPRIDFERDPRRVLTTKMFTLEQDEVGGDVVGMPAGLLAG